MIRVLLVDDDALVRSGLTLMLGGASDIEIVGELDDGAGLADALAALVPDVVLLDIRMPGVDGLTALRSLPETRTAAVLVLTTLGGEDTVLDALRAGAAGFLLKHTPPAQLLTAVRSAAAGEPAVSPEVLRHLIDHVSTASGSSSPNRLEELTDRERAVADALADGLGNAEIAAHLHVSPGTVKAQISSALAKLGLDNRTQLAIAAYEARRG
jgi:DNA-binding NarL/FixJ family response regulator